MFYMFLEITWDQACENQSYYTSYIIANIFYTSYIIANIFSSKPIQFCSTSTYFVVLV